jgi:exodeoxyribonuclease-3
VTFGQRSYNGVAILSTAPLTDVSREFGDGQDDGDARLIAATTHGIRVICVYVPNGQELASEKYPYKLAWLRRLRAYLDRTARPDEPLVLCGDMNVTPGDAKQWSWWDYRGVSFFKDQGLRIDVIFGTRSIAERTTAVTIDRNARKGQDASDHAPVVALIS